ncbi:hypothetical protein HG530_000889 [Fusarium avenaceum]|nr:hypothetical protein HG530_000889 [Fusarium avenaceum]
MLLCHFVGPELTDELETSSELFSQWVNAIVLNPLYHTNVLLAPILEVTLTPHSYFANAQYLGNPESLQKVRVIGMSQVTQVHII